MDDEHAALSSFRAELFAWLDQSLDEQGAEAVRAFCFNLFEPYGIELIGCHNFDPADLDWATQEDFVPSQRGLLIPRAVCPGNWESCQATMTTLLQLYLRRDMPQRARLLNSSAVAIGFVDGDLDYLRRKRMQ